MHYVYLGTVRFVENKISHYFSMRKTYLKNIDICIAIFRNVKCFLFK